MSTGIIFFALILLWGLGMRSATHQDEQPPDVGYQPQVPPANQAVLDAFFARQRESAERTARQRAEYAAADRRKAEYDAMIERHRLR